MSRILFCVAAALVLTGTTAAAQTRLLRYPDIHGGKVVFTHAGDLWTAPAAGGAASRLTSHPGLEQFAKFSPDGEQIAFTGQYDGDEQVYVMPSDGGVPRQLTWYPARGPLPPRWGHDNQVVGWTRDGRSVLFRSMRDGWAMARASGSSRATAWSRTSWSRTIPGRSWPGAIRSSSAAWPR